MGTQRIFWSGIHRETGILISRSLLRIAITAIDDRKPSINLIGASTDKWLRVFIFALLILFQGSIIQDFFVLLTHGTSDGCSTVLEKARKAFSEFISEDFEECCLYCIQNGISVWDYYGTAPGDSRITAAIHELWVDFIINTVDASDIETQWYCFAYQASCLVLDSNPSIINQDDRKPSLNPCTSTGQLRYSYAYNSWQSDSLVLRLARGILFALFNAHIFLIAIILNSKEVNGVSSIRTELSETSASSRSSLLVDILFLLQRIWKGSFWTPIPRRITAVSFDRLKQKSSLVSGEFRWCTIGAEQTASIFKNGTLLSRYGLESALPFILSKLAKTSSGITVNLYLKNGAK